jgi:hypothetical protein
MAAQSGILNKLLFRRAGNARLWTSLSALGIGMALLLMAVLLWWNFNELLHGRQQGDSLGSTFLTVSKRVSNEKMGNAALTVFAPAEIEALKKVPQVEDVGHLLAVKERVTMRMQLSQGLGFSTIMFLEAVPDAFMDKLPPDWTWKEGQVQLPIILSAEFLSLYNYVFAPSQGLPQLSEESIKVLPFQIEVGSDGHEEVYTAHIAGFSDRITSVLVPAAFAEYANRRSGMTNASPPSRLVVKVQDPSAKAFNEYLTAHDYVTNSEQLRWSKLRAVVQSVAGATGVLALLLMGISILVFTLFIELTIARARQSVQLLTELGYSPARLGSFLYKRFLPLLGVCFLVAVVLAVLAQVGTAYFSRSSGLSLAFVPGWPMWVVALFTVVMLFLMVKRAINKALVTS